MKHGDDGWMGAFHCIRSFTNRIESRLDDEVGVNCAGTVESSVRNVCERGPSAAAENGRDRT